MSFVNHTLTRPVWRGNCREFDPFHPLILRHRGSVRRFFLRARPYNRYRQQGRWHVSRARRPHFPPQHPGRNRLRLTK